MFVPLARISNPCAINGKSRLRVLQFVGLLVALVCLRTVATWAAEAFEEAQRKKNALRAKVPHPSLSHPGISANLRITDCGANGTSEVVGGGVARGVRKRSPPNAASNCPGREGD